MGIGRTNGDGLPGPVRFTLWTLYVVGAAAGWWVGHRYWHDPTAGVFVGLGAAALLSAFFDDDGRPVMFTASVFLLLGVPTIYVLVLLAQLPMLAAGLVALHPQVFFVRSLLGALVGVGLMVVYGLKGVFSRAAEPREYGERLDMKEAFIEGMAIRTALAFLVACLFVVPDGESAALLTLGAMWGVLVALVQAVFTVAVDRDGIADGWTRVFLAELLLGLGLVVGLLSSIFDHPRIWATLELVVPAALACVATYGLLHLATAIAARARRRAPEPTPAAPDGNEAEPSY